MGERAALFGGGLRRPVPGPPQSLSTQAVLPFSPAATQRYHERILEAHQAGKSVRQIAEELGAEVYQKTQLLPLDFFQKNCGVLVKQSLKHEGVSPDG